MLFLTNVYQKGRLSLFGLIFPVHLAYSIDISVLSNVKENMSAVGRHQKGNLSDEYVFSCIDMIDTIRPVGEESKKINKALILLSKTNTDIYTELQNARDVFTIENGEFSPLQEVERKNPDKIDYTSSYEQTDQWGNCDIRFSQRYSIMSSYSHDSGFKFSMRMNSDQPREDISERIADSLINLKNPTIYLRVGMDERQMEKVLAHELGHAAYALNHKARARYYIDNPFPDDKATLGHDKNNPNGKAACAAETQFKNNLDQALKNQKKEQKNHPG